MSTSYSTTVPSFQPNQADHDSRRPGPDVSRPARRRLSPSQDSPHSARRFVLSRLSGMVSPDRLDDIALITSELATNAVAHAACPFSVAVSLVGDGAVRIAVTDSDPRHPRLRAAGPTAPSGRGLPLVGALADRWGVIEEAGGKTVWAEVSTNPG